jgi:hypothetical protein
MSRIHARRHFLTTYFDPFYADLYIHPNKPEYNYDTNLFAFLRRRSSEPSYADRLGIDGPIERIQRSIAEALHLCNGSYENLGALVAATG